MARHRSDSDEWAPKPFDLVPFAKHVERTPGKGHDELDLAGLYTGQLVFRLVTLTPLFVGTGSYALGEDVGFPGEPVVRPFYRVNHSPVIPGSSIKGMARSIAEAVSPSCLTVTRVNPRQLPAGVELATARRNACQPTHACPACSIFGRMSQLGKASFDDVYPVSEKPATQLFRLASLYAPRPGDAPKVYLDGQQKWRGAKFYFHSQPVEDPDAAVVEALPQDTPLKGAVSFENLSAAELGLLCFALGLDRTIVLKLGAGKPLGLGASKVTGARLELLGENHFLEPGGSQIEYRGGELRAQIKSLIAAATEQGVLLVAQMEALRQILAPDSVRPAPQGPY
jgi:hypothetical protein